MLFFTNNPIISDTKPAESSHGALQSFSESQGMILRKEPIHFIKNPPTHLRRQFRQIFQRLIGVNKMYLHKPSLALASSGV